MAPRDLHIIVQHVSLHPGLLPTSASCPVALLAIISSILNDSFYHTACMGLLEWHGIFNRPKVVLFALFVRSVPKTPPYYCLNNSVENLRTISLIIFVCRILRKYYTRRLRTWLLVYREQYIFYDELQRNKLYVGTQFRFERFFVRNWIFNGNFVDLVESLSPRVITSKQSELNPSTWVTWPLYHFGSSVAAAAASPSSFSGMMAADLPWT